MLAAERHAAILDRLHTSKTVRVSELADFLGVSEMTIRRDIDGLDAAGALRKVHGGAVTWASLSALEPGFPANAEKELDSKLAIATAAAALVEPGMTVALTGGTTTFQLAGRLPANITVITNSLPAADQLHRFGDPSTTVLLTGGERSPSEALVGPLATAAVRGFNVDICFMGAHGVDLHAGITTPNLAEADTNRAFAQQCASLVLLADHTKFNIISLAHVVHLDRVDSIVTDRRVPGYASLTQLITPTPKDAP
ncbi:DeoR/GlpR family DNA-binding transcription regulator [Arthrobacter sp. H5]|uniref:DeoR/GlpR family DNA-binding transcription regulator n=1 Tax=Arthrobacter sp. H5 TaxID=1267973 RepID=UPI00047FB374|nr:DeoR/GlpR family DNA-binding transcription regulator [Arthrobacter sp. H5]